MRSTENLNYSLSVEHRQIYLLTTNRTEYPKNLKTEIFMWFVVCSLKFVYFVLCNVYCALNTQSNMYFTLCLNEKKKRTLSPVSSCKMFNLKTKNSSFACMHSMQMNMKWFFSFPLFISVHLFPLPLYFFFLFHFSKSFSFTKTKRTRQRAASSIYFIFFILKFNLILRFVFGTQHDA